MEVCFICNACTLFLLCNHFSLFTHTHIYTHTTQTHIHTHHSNLFAFQTPHTQHTPTHTRPIMLLPQIIRSILNPNSTLDDMEYHAHSTTNSTHNAHNTHSSSSTFKSVVGGMGKFFRCVYVCVCAYVNVSLAHIHAHTYQRATHKHTHTYYTHRKLGFQKRARPDDHKLVVVFVVGGVYVCVCVCVCCIRGVFVCACVCGR